VNSMSCVVYEEASLFMGSMVVYLVGIVTVPLFKRIKNEITIWKNNRSSIQSNPTHVTNITLNDSVWVEEKGD
jgi:hypothetical protein